MFCLAEVLQHVSVSKQTLLVPELLLFITIDYDIFQSKSIFLFNLCTPTWPLNAFSLFAA